MLPSPGRAPGSGACPRGRAGRGADRRREAAGRPSPRGGSRARGRGIGRALKLANLENLAAVPEYAAARWIQTCTALDNAPMLALNRALGLREAEVLTVLEAPLR